MCTFNTSAIISELVFIWMIVCVSKWIKQLSSLNLSPSLLVFLYSLTLFPFCGCLLGAPSSFSFICSKVFALNQSYLRGVGLKGSYKFYLHWFSAPGPLEKPFGKLITLKIVQVLFISIWWFQILMTILMAIDIYVKLWFQYLTFIQFKCKAGKNFIQWYCYA